MILKRFFEEKIAQASFLAGCPDSGEAIVIDPNRRTDQYLAAAATEGLRITAVTETHIHADFVSGTRPLAEAAGATIYLSAMGGPEWQYEFAGAPDVKRLAHGDSIQVGRLRLEAMHTPGHTPEHLVFLLTDEAASAGPMAVFTGDFIFAGDVGRPDLLEKIIRQKGSMQAGAEQLFASLRQFAAFPDYLLLWPGHGAGSACGKSLGAAPVTSLGYEKIMNWALRETNKGQFVEKVLEGQPDPPRYFARMKRMNRAGAAAPGRPQKLRRMKDANIGTIREDKAVAIDLRDAEAFAQGFIPGSLHLPLAGNFLAWAGQILPDAATIYFIAAAPSEAADAARALALIGFDRIGGWFSPGALNTWKSEYGNLQTIHLVEPSELPARLQSGSLLVDVRRMDEFNENHIPEARHLPLSRLVELAINLPKKSPVIVHCQSGIRSRIALSLLVQMGFINVAELAGGFARYRECSEGPARKSAAQTPLPAAP